MSEAFPTYLDFFKVLNVYSSEDQGKVILLLNKYSLPAIEYARAKHKFGNKQNLLDLAVFDIFGPNYYALKGNDKLLKASQKLMFTNISNWKDPPKHCIDLIAKMRKDFTDASKNHYSYWQKTLILFDLSPEGGSLSKNDMQWAKAELARRAEKIVCHVFTGVPNEDLQFRKVQALKRIRMDPEAIEASMEDRFNQLCQVVEQQAKELAAVKKIFNIK